MQDRIISRSALIGLLIFSCHSCFAANGTTGSWTASSRNTTVVSYTGSNNIIQGFVRLQAGLTLGASANCTFNGVFPIFGTLTMGSGSYLVLGTNLVLGSNVTFATAGSNIAGNGWQLDLPDDIQSFTLPNMSLGSIKLNLHSNVALSGTTTFTGVCYIDGNGYSIDCSAGEFTIAAGGSLALTDVTFNNVSGTVLSCASNTATFTCINTVWNLSGTYNFNQGNIVVLGDWVVSGANIFTYASPQTLSLVANASIFFDKATTFSYVPSSGSQTLIGFANATASLFFNQATLYAANTGLQFTKGTIIFQGNCPVTSMGTSAANGITFGDNASSSNDASIVLQNSSTVALSSGYLNYKNLNASSCAFADPNGLLAIGDGAALYLYRSLNAAPGGVSFGNSTLGYATGMEITGGYMLVNGTMTYVSF